MILSKQSSLEPVCRLEIERGHCPLDFLKPDLSRLPSHSSDPSVFSLQTVSLPKIDPAHLLNLSF
jgi:hypothetical protein